MYNINKIPLENSLRMTILEKALVTIQILLSIMNDLLPAYDIFIGLSLVLTISPAVPSLLGFWAHMQKTVKNSTI